MQSNVDFIDPRIVIMANERVRFFQQLAQTESEAKTMTVPEEYLPYYRFILAIVAQAVEDQDVEWLRSEKCEKYCTLLGLDVDAIEYSMAKNSLKNSL